MMTMTDKELADKVVALGVAKRFPDEKDWWIYSLNNIGPNGQVARQFVRDWRVAGTVMERCGAFEFRELGDGWQTARDFDINFMAQIVVKPDEIVVIHESLPRAIIEAGVAALETDDA